MRGAILMSIVGLASATLAFGTAGPSLAQTVKAKGSKPECFCTDRYGKRRELGEIICLTVNNRSYEAKCVMAQNVPFWRDLKRGCLSSSLDPQSVTPNATPFPNQPAFTATTLDG